jgi:hypothetical protein
LDTEKRLTLLFPEIDQLALIVDDREDVWNTCLENVVQIYRYEYFTGEGDPNDPALIQMGTQKRERCAENADKIFHD